MFVSYLSFLLYFLVYFFPMFFFFFKSGCFSLCPEVEEHNAFRILFLRRQSDLLQMCCFHVEFASWWFQCTIMWCSQIYYFPIMFISFAICLGTLSLAPYHDSIQLHFLMPVLKVCVWCLCSLFLGVVLGRDPISNVPHGGTNCATICWIKIAVPPVGVHSPCDLDQVLRSACWPGLWALRSVLLMDLSALHASPCTLVSGSFMVSLYIYLEKFLPVFSYPGSSLPVPASD